MESGCIWGLENISVVSRDLGKEGDRVTGAVR